MIRLRAACTRGIVLAVVLAATFHEPARAADQKPTLRVELAIAETSFDPAFASDAASDSVIENIVESMLTYDYLARPVKLVPRTLEAMPVITDNGSTYTFRIRKGIFFTPDPAFRGQRRELVAADYAYSLKRFLDPAVKSPWLWMLEGKLVGGDEAHADAVKTGKFDYDKPLPGLEVVDRYTLRVRLKSPDYRFPFVVAVPNTGAVAREVVEAYGADIGAHPVGTGPFVLGEYKRSSRIVLTANPEFREETYVPAGPVPASLQAVAAGLKGKRLPLAGKIEISVVEEGQARWLAFLNGEVDLLEIVPIELTPQLFTNGKFKPELTAKGIRYHELLRPSIAFTYFNMEDPVVGGYTPEKIALRRAIGMSYNVAEQIRVLLKGRAVPANGPIPPDIVGFDPKLKTQAQLFDPAGARALLDKFGYKDRDGDGFRETPDGKPLVLERWSTPNSAAREADALWQKSVNAIGLKIVFKSDRLPELRKMARLGKIPMRSDGWNADYPDAENFMQLLYGPNAGQENYARFNLPEFNKLFAAARALPDSPERNKLFNAMTELVVAYAPWRLTVIPIEDSVEHSWVQFHVPHPMRSQSWAYVGVDAKARAAK